MENELNRLIKLAQGNRTQNAYALQCGINSATITKIIHEGRTPTPAVLFKLASKAHNGVTYIQLMEAAGYFGSNRQEDDFVLFEDDDSAAEVDVGLSERIWKRMTVNHITPSELAADLQLSESSILEWMEGGKALSAEDIAQIASYFGVSTGSLQAHSAPLEFSEENVVAFMASSGERKRIILSDEEMMKAEEMFRLLFPDKAGDLEDV